MARSMFSPGMFAPRHLSSAIRSLGQVSAPAPPILTAMVISRLSLEKILPRLASMAPLKCFTLAHLLCPAMVQNLVLSCRFKPAAPPIRPVPAIWIWIPTESLGLLHIHRGPVAEHFGDAGLEFGGVVAHADHRIGTQLSGVADHLVKGILARPFGERGVERDVAAEHALNPRAKAADN